MTPVVLVIDVGVQGQTIAAVLHGFSTYLDGVRIAGVILNRVGSERHEAVLRQACETVGIPVLGAVAAGESFSLFIRVCDSDPAAGHSEPQSSGTTRAVQAQRPAGTGATLALPPGHAHPAR